jgi:RHS repeat-associated protein
VAPFAPPFKRNDLQPTKIVEYTYDVWDRRIEKRDASNGVDANGNVQFDRSEQFVYDENRDLLLAFADPDGDAATFGSSLTNRYLNGAMVDQVLADEVIDGSPGEMGDVYWPLADNLGSNRDVVRRDAVFGTQAVEHLRFDAFGEIEQDTNATYTQRQTYAGLEYDADTGLYYALHRWYDPATHRFISEDPSSFLAGDVNLARYVFNSSPNFVDPSGRAVFIPRPIHTIDIEPGLSGK